MVNTPFVVGFFAALGAAIVGVFLVGLPFVRLWHLLGHAAVMLAVTDEPVHLRLGSDPTRGVRYGRLVVAFERLPWHVGFCEPESNPFGRERFYYDIAGPAASLVLAVGLTELYLVVPKSLAPLSIFVWGTWCFAVGQVVLCVAPAGLSEEWSSPYAGMTSDLKKYWPWRVY